MYITKEEVLAQTNGGLDVILRIYPQAEPCQHNQNKKFKIRTSEKTASAKLQRKTDGTWVVTDFGGDGKGQSAIALVMQEQKLDFAEAIQWIAKEFGLQGSDGKKARLYESKVEPAKPDEKENEMRFFRKNDFSDFEIKTMFSESLLQWLEAKNKQKQKPDKDPYKAAKEILKKYNWSALEAYSLTKGGKTHTFMANDNFPMFVMDEPTSGCAKLYKPKEPEKAFRFQYYPLGSLPKDHVWGMTQLKDAYREIQKRVDDFDNSEKDKDEKRPDDKIEYVLICSGERDSMNAALMGYFPVWQNSETKGISRQLIKELTGMGRKVVNVPDIDSTGVTMGVKAALEHIELLTAWLPAELSRTKDQRGNPCKDLRDYLAVKDEKGTIRWRKKDFDRLIKTAKKAQFWQKIYVQDKEEWYIDSVNLLYFLWCSGFRKLKNEGVKDGYQFVQVSGHMVTEVDPKQIRNYVRLYLEQHYQDNKLMNKFLRSTVLSDGQLEYLEDIELDFTAHGPDYQRLYFINQAWEVRKDEIRILNSSELARSESKVWAKSVIQHRVTRPEPMFEVFKNDEGSTLVRPLNNTCLFLKYLIATCRVHWRKEEKLMLERNYTLEAQAEYFKATAYSLDGLDVAQFLTREEMDEQLRHLANKLFTFGYLLHNYKDPAKPWGVYALDAKLSEEGQSHGRSGKSLFMKAVREMLETKTISGRNTDITRNAYLYDGVTKFTRLILVDDCNEFLKYDHFFTPLTDNLTVNPKFVREFELPFSDSPKFAFTSNYALKNPDPSLLGRLQFTVFSDFFHEQTNESDYQESRSPRDWCGKNLFGHDFTEAEWITFYHLAANAIQFYLNCSEKITAPMGEVNLRALKSTMGEAFLDWATLYFSLESGNLNRDLVRAEVYESCLEYCKFKSFTTREFTRRLKAFVKYMKLTAGDYSYNPADKTVAKDGRIIKRNNNTGKTEEYIHVSGPEGIFKAESFADQAFENQDVI